MVTRRNAALLPRPRQWVDAIYLHTDEQLVELARTVPPTPTIIHDMFRTRSFDLCVALGTAGVSPDSLLASVINERKPPDAELKLGWLFDLGAFWYWDWESRHPCAGIRTAHARRHPMVALLLGRPLPPRVLFRVMG